MILWNCLTSQTNWRGVAGPHHCTSVGSVSGWGYCTDGMIFAAGTR